MHTAFFHWFEGKSQALLMEAFDAGFQFAQLREANPKWKLCTVEMPPWIESDEDKEYSDYVLIMDIEYKELHVAKLVRNKSKSPTQNEAHWISTGTAWRLNKVSHWMTLPDTPE